MLAVFSMKLMEGAPTFPGSENASFVSPEGSHATKQAPHVCSSASLELVLPGSTLYWCLCREKIKSDSNLANTHPDPEDWDDDKPKPAPAE